MARHRGLFWAGVLCAVVLVVAGGAVAWFAYRQTDGPDGAVRGYFEAIARDDAAAALGYGTVPHGATPYLTDAVLKQQSAIAPMSGIGITDVTQHGRTAEVGYTYRLDFADGPQQVKGTLRTSEHGTRWRLDTVAAHVGLQLAQAQNRAALATTPIPVDPVWLFPGAIPIRFDSPDLELAASTDDVRLSDVGTISLRAQVAPAAKERLTRQLTAMLHTCVTSTSLAQTADCPLPDDRYVPGSLHGTIARTSVDGLGYNVALDAGGELTVGGHVTFHGTYDVLDFQDVVHHRSGALSIPVQAQASLAKDLQLSWVNHP